MKKHLLFFFTAMLALAWQNAKAQDLIYKKNKEVILAKIVEMGTDEVKYKEYNSKSDIIFAIAKAEIWKVKFENGKEQFFVDDFNNPNFYSDNKKNAIKVDFLAPLYYRLSFSYERSLKPGMSYEAGFGIIGIGYNPYNTNENSYNNYSKYDASGAFGRFGIKFIKTPDYYLKGMRYAHILKGSYIKPEFTLGSFHETHEGTTYTYPAGGSNPVYSIQKSQKDVVFGAVMLNFGKQWVFNDVFLVDYYFGLGYCFDNRSTNDKYFNPYNFAVLKFGESPFAVNAGLKVGILLK